MNRVAPSRGEPRPLPGPDRDEHGQPSPEHELAVLQAIRDTRFGTIEVTVHQSRIVQITRSEKLRF
jgi:hypothetical protein